MTIHRVQFLASTFSLLYDSYSLAETDLTLFTLTSTLLHSNIQISSLNNPYGDSWVELVYSIYTPFSSKAVAGFIDVNSSDKSDFQRDHDMI